MSEVRSEVKVGWGGISSGFVSASAGTGPVEFDCLRVDAGGCSLCAGNHIVIT